MVGEVCEYDELAGNYEKLDMYGYLPRDTTTNTPFLFLRVTRTGTATGTNYVQYIIVNVSKYGPPSIIMHVMGVYVLPPPLHHVCVQYSCVAHTCTLQASKTEPTHHTQSTSMYVQTKPRLLTPLNSKELQEQPQYSPI